MSLHRWVIFVNVAIAGFAQVQSRGIVPEGVVQARPASKPAAPVSPKPKYQLTGDEALKSLRQPASATRQVGVTVWRLRPGLPSDSGARILVQEDFVTTEWIPERVGVTTGLHAGDRVRMTIESPDPGYLYVIDRERYASGERGAPYLIFPTARTRGGDNRVMGGKLIDIPAQDDRPNFFSLRHGRPDQVEEE